MKKIVGFFLLLATLVSCSPAAQETYTIIVSLDGFRADYKEWYNTPHLDAIGESGVAATMLPSLPASTFPNHYTLATGLVPDHHGIVDNTFWDTETEKLYSMGELETRSNTHYYGGEPIWITAMKQGLKVGTVYWVGSDLPICGSYPTYYHDYQVKPLIAYENRIDTVMDWLRKPLEERPRFVMCYFDEPDGSGHRYSPRGDGTRLCIEYMDSLMGQLYDSLQTLDIADRINLIITSDHGMASISDERVVKPSDYVQPHWVERMTGGTPTSIRTIPEYRDSVYNALKDVEHLRVYKREEIPTEWNYGSYTTRIGDIVVMPEAGWQFTDREGGRALGGAHGYVPTDEQMQVMFVATGVDFKKGFKAEKFNNTDIYIMICRLLGITPEATDGDMTRIEQLFAK